MTAALAFRQILVTLLEAGQRERGLLPEPPPALPNQPKEKRVGRPEAGRSDCGFSSDRGQRRRRGWSPQVSRKTLEALGKAVTPGSKQLEPELRACLSLGSNPSDRAVGSTAALGSQRVFQALGGLLPPSLPEWCKGTGAWLCLHAHALRPRPSLEGVRLS